MVERAVQASGRGVALTDRLLAFSRKQVLQPEAINLQFLVSEMADMLVRTLGEAIEVTTAAEDELWLCDVDASQIESAILNLAINARDAMPRSGVLTIEAVNLPAGESGAALPPALHTMTSSLP